jgi:D-glycero-D-manno-heptose 1,7-bisphosphate phosphatase
VPRPAIFLDRDGVINENRASYVRSWADVALLPGALDALARLAGMPHAIVVITNQSAIGRGLVPEQTVREIHQRMQDAVASAGGRIDAFYCCPHHPDEGCACRKPNPGLLLQAAEELDLDLAASYLVGDAASDVEAAVRAGICPILVLTGRGQDQVPLLPEALRPACAIAPDLPAAVAWIADDLHRKS